MATQNTTLCNIFEGAPKFNHPDEIRHLYESGWEIDRNILRRILALPRETMLDDLAAMLEDAKERYAQFAKRRKAPEDFLNLSHTGFPLHALFLLQEIDSPRAFDLVMSFISTEIPGRCTNRKFTDFWLGTHITETLDNIIARCGRGREEELAAFAVESNASMYIRVAATTALKRIAQNYPERTRGVQQLFDTIFQHFLDADPIEDPELVAFAILDYVETSPNPVSPLVYELYEAGLVEEIILGDYTDAQIIAATRDPSDIKTIDDIFSIYDQLDKLGSMPAYKNNPLPQLGLYKTGRNDPCPCGSGKKYKKCCLK